MQFGTLKFGWPKCRGRGYGTSESIVQSKIDLVHYLGVPKSFLQYQLKVIKMNIVRLWLIKKIEERRSDSL